jgi:hypothetical protein
MQASFDLRSPKERAAEAGEFEHAVMQIVEPFDVGQFLLVLLAEAIPAAHHAEELGLLRMFLAPRISAKALHLAFGPAQTLVLAEYVEQESNKQAHHEQDGDQHERSLDALAMVSL